MPSEPKITDPFKYLTHVVMMGGLAEALCNWDVATGEQLEANIANDEGLDAGKRIALSAFIGALNAAAGQAEKFVALDQAITRTLLDRVTRC